MISRLAIAVIVIASTGGFGLAQSPAGGSQGQDQVKKDGGSASSSSSSSGQPGSGGIVASSDDYLIEPSDVLDVHIEDAPELCRKVVVASDGSFPLPYVNTVVAKGKTTVQLEKEIAGRLKGRYLKDPQVTVSVLQYNSRTFFIQGAVRGPGPYTIRGKATMLKLITIAGGLLENHGSSAFIIREINDENSEEKAPTVVGADRGRGGSAGSDGQTVSKGKETPERQVLKVDINALFRGDFSQDAVIEPGDIVNIPASDIFFIVGEVKKAGTFPLRDGISLQQAISMAEGLTQRAAGGSAMIFRIDPLTRKRQEIKVDIASILRGKAEDMPVMANDTIVIPNSKSKTVLTTLFNGFGQTALHLPLPY
ncbi:MAG TPA: polysaccharide biosynthesis/export family protein [Blastocatellia bacterium]|nr:polysaccharide biosynthesis/export family protein [Blastocatellia bacterium]